MSEHLNSEVQQTVPAGSLQSSYHGIAARLDRLPWGPSHRKALFLIGGLIFCDSLDTNVAGPIIAQLLASGWSDNGLNALFVSMTMFGYLVGNLVAGWISDLFGRVRACIVNVTIFSAGCFAACAAPDMTFLIGCRFVMGIGLGAAYPAGYGALAEYTPPKNRGQSQGWLGFIGNCGTPFATLVSLALLPMFGWRAIFVFCGCAGVLVAVLIAKFMDESPRWLAMQGRYDEADAVVKKWERKALDSGADVQPVSDELIKAEENRHKVEELPAKVLFTNKKLLKRMIVASVLLWTGDICLYTIVTWTPTIFVSRGFDVTYSVAMTVAITLGAPIGVLIMSAIVDRFGRKPQFMVMIPLSGAVGFAWAMIPVDQIVLIMVVGFISTAMVYYWTVMDSAVYIPELFPTEVKVRGAGIANAIGRIGVVVSPMWIAYFLDTGGGAVAIFGVSFAMCVATVIVVALMGVETKGKTLEKCTEEVFAGRG